MPDDKKPDEVLQDAGEQKPDNAPQPEAAPAAGDAEARLKALDNDLRHEKAERTKLVKKLEAFEKAENDRKNAELSETERLKKELDEAKGALTAKDQQIQERAIRSAVHLEAVRLGFNDPDDAYRADVLAALTVNEDGEVTGVKEALAKLAQDKPYLVGGKPRPLAPSTDAGIGNQPERGGEVLTRGEMLALGAAQRLGYAIDPQKAAQRKAQGRVVSGRARDKDEQE